MYIYFIAQNFVLLYCLINKSCLQSVILYLAFDCGENSSYQAEMSLDVATCQNPDAIYDIPSGTGEGCACDEGYIHDAGRCVLEEHCGCLLGEDRYVEVA